MRQFELANDIDRKHLKIRSPDHLDHQNSDTFEIEDLKRLILQTAADLEEADKKRRQDFKQYELQKEFEKQQKLKDMDEEHRKLYEEELKKMEEKHNKHEKVHHPGNQAQLEEVWEKQDHMEGADFDPKSFFMMHDLDSNGYWDENEVKALFVHELNKVYQQGLPEDDFKERAEEMERMREHVFKEADTNRDGLLSFNEFIDQTKREEFREDPGWDTVNPSKEFSHDEFLEFERQRNAEIQQMIADGRLPAHPNMPGGYYPNQQAPPYQAHPNEIPHGNAQYHYQQPNHNDQYQQAQYQQQNVQYQQQQPNYQQQHANYPQQQQPQHPNQAPHGQQVNLNANQVYDTHAQPNVQHAQVLQQNVPHNNQPPQQQPQNNPPPQQRPVQPVQQNNPPPAPQQINNPPPAAQVNVPQNQPNNPAPNAPNNPIHQNPQPNVNQQPVQQQNNNAAPAQQLPNKAVNPPVAAGINH